MSVHVGSLNIYKERALGGLTNETTCSMCLTQVNFARMCETELTLRSDASRCNSTGIAKVAAGLVLSSMCWAQDKFSSFINAVPIPILIALMPSTSIMLMNLVLRTEGETADALATKLICRCFTVCRHATDAESLVHIHQRHGIEIRNSFNSVPLSMKGTSRAFEISREFCGKVLAATLHTLLVSVLGMQCTKLEITTFGCTGLGRCFFACHYHTLRFL